MEPYPNDYFDREVCRPYECKGGDCGVLLVHGFTGTCAHMRKLADSLAQRGYTVRTINLPGHASSEDDMRKADWQQWLQAVKQASLEMMQQVKTFTICGLSMGGVLALLVAQQMKVDACVPISAPTAVQNRLLPLAGLCAPLLPRIAWGPGTERHAKLDKAYDFGYSGFPTAKGADLHKLIQMARKNLFSITCPVLCVQSDADETIWKGSADEILGGVSSSVRQKLWLHDVPHVCTISHELPAIADAMDSLMQRVHHEKAQQK
ncbi:MAG: alpha/beta fold hydrolase [Clostridia bacterium]|nr:alpha/beta fold hydrolase [Clostridia bacterium]